MQNTSVSPEDPYYGHLRMSLLNLIEGRPRRVLEIGCGHGQALSFVKRRYEAEYVAGIEMVPEVAAIARNNNDVDIVITGDIELIELDFSPGYFDLVIASHVLEHVKNPWGVARQIAKLISPHGQFVGSLPNVRHARVVLPLVFLGKLEYTTEGVLDWTHTKFFTKATIQDLLRTSGFLPEKIEPEFLKRPAIFNNLTFGIFQNFLCFTYNFSARPHVRV